MTDYHLDIQTPEDPADFPIPQTRAMSVWMTVSEFPNDDYACCAAMTASARNDGRPVILYVNPTTNIEFLERHAYQANGNGPFIEYLGSDGITGHKPWSVHIVNTSEASAWRSHWNRNE
jgi:hypothetical protein